MKNKNKKIGNQNCSANTNDYNPSFKTIGWFQCEWKVFKVLNK